MMQDQEEFRMDDFDDFDDDWQDELDAFLNKPRSSVRQRRKNYKVRIDRVHEEMMFARMCNDLDTLG